MANDAYLKLSGISGVATDSAHTHWIEITSFSFGIRGPDGLARSTDANKEAPKPDDISISKKVDKASPLLAKAAADPVKYGNKTATIALCGRSGPKVLTTSIGGLPTYMKYELKQVWIKSYTVTGGSGYATETLSLGFYSVEWIYTDGNISGKWDILKNEVS